jgi:CHASE3 domain sensor protein
LNKIQKAFLISPPLQKQVHCKIELQYFYIYALIYPIVLMKQIQKRSKRNLLIGFGVSLLILIASSGISYLSIEQLLDSQKLVEHTNEVETTLESMISRMKDAETGQRGFLLTGEEAFLEPYTGAKTEVLDLFTKAQSLTRDNAEQQVDFPLLEKLINSKFESINGSIANKKAGIPATVTLLLKGKSVMDSIRTTVSAMVVRENKLMTSRNSTMNKFATWTPILIGLAALFSMLITIIFYFKVQGDAQLAANLQNELIRKEQKTSTQISAIGEIAEKIAKGDYTARVDRKDME